MARMILQQWLIGSQLAKMKKYIPKMSLPWNLEGKKNGLKKKQNNYTLKITIFANMWNLGQFLENLIFCQ